MKKHIRSIHVLLGTAALLVAVLLVGCQDTETPVGPELDTSAVSETAGVSAGAKPDCEVDPTHPSCGGDDGGGGNAFTVAMTGGLGASAQVVELRQDTKKRIIGEADVFDVTMNLMATQVYAAQVPIPGDCSFNCDDPNLDCDPGGAIHQSLAEAFVTSGPDPVRYPGLSVAFDKDAAVEEEALSNCPFTGLSQISLEQGGGVVIRNCMVTYDDGDGDPSNNAQTIDDDTIARTFMVHAHENTNVSTGRRFDANGDGEVGQTEYRASLNCPLQLGDVFSVTFAPE